MKTRNRKYFKTFPILFNFMYFLFQQKSFNQQDRNKYVSLVRLMLKFIGNYKIINEITYYC